MSAKFRIPLHPLHYSALSIMRAERRQCQVSRDSEVCFDSLDQNSCQCDVEDAACLVFV